VKQHFKGAAKENLIAQVLPWMQLQQQMIVYQ